MSEDRGKVTLSHWATMGKSTLCAGLVDVVKLVRQCEEGFLDGQSAL